VPDVALLVLCFLELVVVPVDSAEQPANGNDATISAASVYEIYLLFIVMQFFLIFITVFIMQRYVITLTLASAIF
jgi:hypothetical protein